MIYIRMIGTDYFEYLLEFGGEIYSSYIIITPQEGKKKLSKREIFECMALIHMGAEATLDSLLGVDKVKEAEDKYIEMSKKSNTIVAKEQKKCLKKITG